MSKYCEQCGALLNDADAFCQTCGHPAAAAATPQSPVAPQQPAQAYAAPAGKKAKGKAGLVIGIIAGVAVVAALLVVLLVPGILNPAAPGANFSGELMELPKTLAAPSGEVAVHCTYDAPEIIVPALYRSMDYIVYLKSWTDSGQADVLVTVEIPGLTQKFEQKVPVTRAETQMKILPPIEEGAAKTLNSSKNAQLKVTVTDIKTGNVIVQDSRQIQLYSRYDMQWQGEDGTQYHENFLAWLTPEAPEIGQLLRDLADSLSTLTNGYLTSVVGYQQQGDYSVADMSYAQACAVMYTLAHTYQVKYVASPFSATDTNLQRVKTPAEVINSRAGLCCETAVTVASALQAMQMHAVMILLPGHMQTAVETGNGTGEYYLIETTALDAAATGNFQQGNPVVTYMTKDQWLQYVSQDGYEVIDCSLAQSLNIKSID
jgi:hypothetical protein